jgi:hypothetical protein
MEVNHSEHSDSNRQVKNKCVVEHGEMIGRMKDTETNGRLVLEIQKSDKEGAVTVFVTEIADSFWSDMEGGRAQRSLEDPAKIIDKNMSMELLPEEGSVTEKLSDSESLPGTNSISILSHALSDHDHAEHQCENNDDESLVPRTDLRTPNEDSDVILSMLKSTEQTSSKKGVHNEESNCLEKEEKKNIIKVLVEEVIEELLQFLEDENGPLGMF